MENESGIVIKKAVYYTEQNVLDVTEIVSGLVKDNKLYFIVSNELFKKDPHPMLIKKLKIDCIVDGVEKFMIADEGQVVEIISKLSAKQIMTDIIIPTYNNEALTVNCFNSIKKYTKEGTYRIIWVDNNSKKKELVKQILEGVNHISIFLTENQGFVGAVNEGLKISDTDSVCLLNNDTVVTDRWLEKLNSSLYNNKKLGIIGPMTGYGGDSPHSLVLNRQLLSPEAEWWGIEKVNNYLEKNYSGRTIPVSFVAFLCALIKREVIDIVGLLDVNFDMGMWDDVDWNRQAQAHGYDIALAIDTCIYHKGRSTFHVVEREEGLDVKALLKKNKAYLDKKWGYK